MQKEGGEESNDSRKTLKQQLSENRTRRFQEFQSRVQSKNSTFLLDEKTAKFYEGLRQKELEKDQQLKQKRALEQRRAEQLKQQQKELTRKNSLGITKPSKTIRILKKPKDISMKSTASAVQREYEQDVKPNVSSMVSGYSSSEEESD